MTGFFDLPGWALPLARRVLYFWVRPTVFPENPQELGLDPAKPVCYVLQDHHLSNLLVLFKESQSAGLPPAIAPIAHRQQVVSALVFFPQPQALLSATARQRYAPSTLMTALMREALADPELDVQIVPVVILWGRSPDKQESILKALFSETWRQPGPLRRFLTILLHGRNVLVRFNPPIALSSISAKASTRSRRCASSRACCACIFAGSARWPSVPTSRTATRRSKRCLPRRRCAQAIAERSGKARHPAGRAQSSGRAALRSRSLPTIRTAPCARSNCFSPGCGRAFTTASKRTTSTS
jgi:glycerol-3-phosphate O-acyltransferase